MKRLNVWIDEHILTELTKLGGTFSEHIRVALRQYLETFKKVSTSQSKRGSE